MKKILLILIALFGLNVMGNAQYASLRWENSTSLKLQCSLTRTYRADQSVVCGWDNGQWRMYLCNNSDYFTANLPFDFGDYIDLPLAIAQIYDMRVLNDYVFFCGRTGTHQGVIGYINLLDFSSPPVAVEYTIIPEVAQFNRLAAYKDSYGKNKVVAIGQEEHPNPPYVQLTSAILEVSDITGTPIFAYKTLPNIEVLHEVFFSDDNYMVYFVEYSQSLEALGLRMANPDDVLNDAIIDNLYYFPTGDIEVYSQTHSAISHNRLAVSYMYGGYSGTFSTRIRYFDLSTMKMFNSQEFVFDDKSEPYDITFLDDGNRAVLIQPFEFPSGLGSFNTNFIWLNPNLNNPYTDFILYHKDEIYSSLDKMTEYSFIACGQKFRYQQNWNASFLSSSPVCPYMKKYNIEIIDLAPQYQITIPPILDSITHTNYSPSIIPINDMATSCFEK